MTDARWTPSAPTAGTTAPDDRTDEPHDARPARLRPPLLLQGLASAVVAAALLGLTEISTPALVVGTLVVQVLLGLGLLALVDAPAAGGVFAIGAAATGAADAVVLVDDGRVAGLAGVVALSLVAGLLHQLCRRRRSRVTESLAATLVLVVLSCSAACLPAALQLPHGALTVRCALAAAGCALLAGRLGDAVVRRPAVVVGAARGWPGLVLGLGAGVAGCAVVAGGDLPVGRAALLGLAAAAAVVTGDVLADLAAAELRPGGDDARRVAALRPVGLLLPFAVLGPVVLVAVRLLSS